MYPEDLFAPKAPVAASWVPAAGLCPKLGFGRRQGGRSVARAGPALARAESLGQSSGLEAFLSFF